MNVNLKEKRILITGGAGFIGSHLAAELLKQEKEVFVLDNLSSGYISNLPTDKKLKFFQGDIRDADLVEKLIAKCDMVFHLAEFIPNTSSFGSGHVIKYSVNDPLCDFDVSTRGTLIVLNCAKKYKRKFVFASTAAVYGNAKNPLKENFRPRPISPYGVSKLCAEEYVKLYSRIYHLKTSIARFFNVYGPRQYKYVMYDILLKLKENPGCLRMLGTGEQIRDFVYVKDAVNALMLIAQDDFTHGQVYNVGSGRPTRIKDLVNIIVRILDVNPKVVFLGSSWKGDAKTLVADISKISRIGYRPDYSLKNGIKELVKWFYKNRCERC